MDIDELPPELELQPSSLDVALANVLEVIPDVAAEYAQMLCEKFLPEFGQSASVPALNFLIENPGYPKV
jgi:hypothetical protein